MAALDAFAAHLAETNAPGTTRFIYMMNLYVIEHFLGADWLDRHASLDAHPNSFLKPKFDERDMAPLYSVRILQLAEMLLNLQGVQGLYAVLENLEGDQLQSGYAELQVGMVLMQRGVPFRYVDPKLEQGKTFDLELLLPSGEEGRGEIKCKYADTPYSDGTLRDALERARGQISAGNSGVVFVKIPEDWVQVSQGHPRERATMALPPEIVAAARDGLRQTSRIKKLIFYITQMGFDPDWGISTTHCTMEMNNAQNPTNSPWNAELLGSAIQTWVDIPHLIKRWVERHDER